MGLRLSDRTDRRHLGVRASAPPDLIRLLRDLIRSLVAVGARCATFVRRKHQGGDTPRPVVSPVVVEAGGP